MRRAQHPVEVEIMTGEPIHVMAAPGRLAQVLDHLIQNAVEASDRGVPVRLRVEVGDGAVAIEVIDRGGGMSPGFVRDQLFRPFVSTKPNGFGIGAYEARELVRAMDGRLDVSSREGEGTRFRILLATAAAATLDAAA
jgi:signal transduction histidine kinase